MKKVYI